ncbi:hypothetical protein PSN13_05791 [Micromonospora saelicesensis]|uniref:Uncharacterized protein n=1 Tax=Micromonospora saelicesensis TaxID=285676 RepID=A0A328NJB3_9ACTN|nr:hypothetical protein [Micromonospora saelicesensis]RAO27903.1 hypothetical protein PSN13_05791 [Micromonospora saelicesensis]
MALTPRQKLVRAGFLIPLAYFVLLITTSLGDVWAAWWSGDSTADIRLWWWPMLIWSRLGKSLQLLAGLTVILDLIDLDKLRQFAVKLDRRGRDLSLLAPIERHRAKVYGVREELAGCIVDTKTLAARGGATLDISSLRVKPSLTVSEATTNMLSTVDVPELLSRIHAEAAKEGWSGAKLTRRVRARIDSFLAGQLGPGEQGWSGEVAYQFRARSSIFGIFGLVVAVVLTAAVSVALTSTTLSGWISAPIAIAVFFVSVTIGILPFDDWRLGGSLLAAWRLGCARVLCLFADMIGITRPGHVFRWVALLLFLAGMHFDLLAA